MTPEELEKRRAYQREYMRRKRAAQKTAKPVAVKAQHLESYYDVSAPMAKSLQRAWRKEVSEYLLDVLTRPESPLTGASMRSCKMLCLYFGLSEKLDRIVDKEKAEMTEEFTLAVLLECLRRLSGEKPSVPISVLPGTI